MLKQMLNEARFTFFIKATGPILIKEGENDNEKQEKQPGEGQLMKFVQDANKKPFIPGSSIKGVWRSWCEKMARTISDDMPLACDPFNDNDQNNQSCSRRLENLKTARKLETTAYIYAESCPICKLFGNTSLASRIKISDAYPLDAVNTKVRDGIGIDRFTGGTSHGAKFQYEYIIGNTFKADIQIRNFELWQLGLLGYLFKDFNEELVPIGFGKTRGLGKVKGTLGEANLIFYGLNRSKIENKHATITGIGGLYKDKDINNYCFDTNSSLQIEGIENTSVTETAIKTTIKLNNTQADEFFKKSANYWATLRDGKPDGYFKTSQEKRNKKPEGT